MKHDKEHDHNHESFGQATDDKPEMNHETHQGSGNHHPAENDHDDHNHAGQDEHEHHSHHDHHAMMIADFRRRFWVSLALTIPILILAPMIQQVLGLRETLSFPGESWVMLALSTALFFYGGWPFLKGLYDELRSRNPGMMTLIGLAISIAFVYSVTVNLGLPGHTFFWELATLIDVMLVGHWIEMRSV
ncbi:MAG TPA: heavy metal translocating P-type ATPase, partial [Bacteroidetes bacterium]|nr:heavy metal translocating P-type ATPase [Bacteroidota bacterium]HEX05452.1 heavy metal translocating P-type ATPase [Bacteroidota bacterium]